MNQRHDTNVVPGPRRRLRSLLFDPESVSPLLRWVIAGAAAVGMGFSLWRMVG